MKTVFCLSKYQKGRGNGYSLQLSLIVMFEGWRESLDKGGKCGGLLIDFYKAFDSYEFSYSSPKPILSFLDNRKYRTKINSVCIKVQYISVFISTLNGLT